MKCVSIPQPWAWAILAGVQRSEYRCYPTDHRGDLLIHATRGSGDWERRQLAVLGERAPRWENLPFNQVLGVVELLSCEQGSEGEWIWELRNPRPIEPFRLEAGKGLFEVNDEQVRPLPANGRGGKKTRKKRSPRGRRTGRRSGTELARPHTLSARDR
jgi:hypothetical protein